MTSNSDFFDASELFNIPEQFDIPDTFYRVDELSKKFNVSLEDIRSAWLDDKINLYVNLRSEYCRIVRYANKKEHRYDTFDIRAGGDFYQHESSSQFSVKTFIPCDQSEINEYPVFSGSSFFKYVYDGYASGFWKLKPTKMAHLVRDNYNLRNANEVWGSIPSEVIVYGRDDKDNLTFNKDIFIPHADLQIDGDSYQKLLKSLAPESNEFKKAEKSYIQNFITAIFIYKHCRKNDNKLKAMTATGILNSLRESYCKEIEEVKRSTVDRWFDDYFDKERDSLTQLKNGGWSQKKDDVISIVARSYYWNDNFDVMFEFISNDLLEEAKRFNLQKTITQKELIDYLRNVCFFSAYRTAQ
ncbi:hypothetical protein MX989_20765 [Enterobacter sichuanensis]|uniref:Uncharacterized protein n=1 Tax=Enterobacter sichuanensis TaxID=2071710 RepID=A0AAE4J1G5_9ENTR|nr:hypothetical protein [Enterobacter sichuanensis]MDR9948490.1 hypothetical protein [Enterobacter sichuanensis]